MQDVASILQRTIPKEQSAPISQAESPSESLTTYMTWADKFLTNTTEMEVNARILPLVLDTVSWCDNVIINLQLSVDGHQVFTDFCFVTRDEKSPLSLIEAKKGANVSDLCIETASTAQVLREVHILMCKNHSFTFTHCTDQLHGVVIWAGRKGDRNGQNQSDKVFPAANEEG